MKTKVKRTYNLSPESVETVKQLVEQQHLAPTQDALVELAISELARRKREIDEAEQWARAAHDPEFQAESEELDRAFLRDDIEAWEV